MAYTPDTALFREQIAGLRRRVGAGRPLWAGIGAYRLTQASVVDKVRAAREAGASGVILFSSDSLATSDLDQLRDQAFPPAGGARGAVPAHGSLPR
jgi:hypothetical protein